MSMIGTDCYSLSIGLNSKTTLKQQFSTYKLKKIVENVCRNYKISFTMQVLHGGYFHEDGRFVAEKSLQLVLIGSTKEQALDVAKDICVFLDQESVLLVMEKIAYEFIHEEL